MVRTRTPIAERLRSDDPVLGARATTMSPSVVEVYGDLGFDFTWLDFEHTGGSPYDSTLLERYTSAADAAGIDLLVRLPAGDPPMVRKVLDSGVQTLLIPHVEGVTDIQPAIEAAHYRYDGGPGSRGAGIGRGDRWGGETPDVSAADERVAVGAMIETRAAIEHLDDILAVPELGFIVIGPSDLSISHGHPYDRDHETVRDVVDRARRAAIDAGVPVGGVTNDLDDAREKLANGYQLLRVGDEVSAARALLGDRLSSLRK
jgi:2-dehydro-3-deoxyglucarate aldolase